MIGELSIPQGWKASSRYLDDSEALNPEVVRCCKHEGVDCRRCDGSGFRQRGECAGCGARAGIEAKALSPECSAKSWGEAKALPLYCIECNPRIFSRGMTRTRGDSRERMASSLLLAWLVAMSVARDEEILTGNRQLHEAGKGVTKKARQEG